MTTENTAGTAVQTTPKDGDNLPAEINDLIADAGRGVENIGVEDVRPPRLTLCQAGTPQRKTDDPKQIPNLQELDLFNNLSNEIYGRAVKFAVISMLGHTNIEFYPSGGSQTGVKEFDIPDDDDRCKWTKDADGNRVKPVATKFYNYLVWLIEQQEGMILSFKSTQIPVGIKLNGLLKLPLKLNGQVIPNPPAWARVYQVETKMEKDGDLSWGGYNLSTIGVTPPETRIMLSKLANDYSKKTITIDYTEDAPGATDADAPHGAGAAPGDATDM